MGVCQISIKKNPAISVIPLLRQLAIIVERHSGKPHPLINARKDIFVVRVATGLIAERLCHPTNNPLGEAALAKGKHINDIARKIQNELLISRLVDMREKKELRVTIPLKNGKNSKRDIEIAVPFVASIRNLLKTILFHYQKVAQTTSQIFNPCVVVATAKSGETILDYFNIYEHSNLRESLKDKIEKIR